MTPLGERFDLIDTLDNLCQWEFVRLEINKCKTISFNPSINQVHWRDNEFLKKYNETASRIGN